MKIINTFLEECFAKIYIPESYKRIILFFPGLPTKNCYQDFLQILADRTNSIVVDIRYPGTWESKSLFVTNDFCEKIKKAINSLNKNIKDVFTNTIFKFQYEEIIILGYSFGSFVGLNMLKELNYIKKAIFVSPVFSLKELLTTNLPHEEGIKNLLNELNILNSVYRFKQEDYNKLINDLIIPNYKVDVRKLNGKKIYFIIGEKDLIISYERTKKILDFLEKNKVWFNVDLISSAGHSLIKMDFIDPIINKINDPT